MVKGVNKTVIEVNDTGSEYFDKIILYVSPKYAGASPIKIQKAVNSELGKINDNVNTNKKSLRQMVNARRKRRNVILVGSIIAIITSIVITAIILI